MGWYSACRLVCSVQIPLYAIFFFFFSLKFSKFMPVLLVGTGAGAVDTAKKKNNFFPLRLCRLAGQCKRLGGIK